MTHDHAPAVARFLEAITRADAGTMLALMHPDVEWVVPKTAVAPYAGRHRGAGKIVEMMVQAVQATFLPGTVVHRVLAQVGDARRIMVETEMTAKQASGREYRNSYVFIFEFRGERIGEIREHVDTAYALQFFGAEQEGSRTS